eukprot:11869343-Alexandrium_andersonii.AAC.1
MAGALRQHSPDPRQPPCPAHPTAWPTWPNARLPTEYARHRRGERHRARAAPGSTAPNPNP